MAMLGRRIDPPLLGAEAVPGGLEEINRVRQNWLEIAPRAPRPARAPHPREGLVETVLRWLDSALAR